MTQKSKKPLKSNKKVMQIAKKIAHWFLELSHFIYLCVKSDENEFNEWFSQIVQPYSTRHLDVTFTPVHHFRFVRATGVHLCVFFACANWSMCPQKCNENRMQTLWESVKNMLNHEGWRRWRPNVREEGGRCKKRRSKSV